MRILGIESSCDETGAAVVEDGVKIISNALASSQEIHKASGGIIPEQAAREQVKSIIPVVREAIKRGDGNFDAIAVTYGPGLIGSLLVGVETAKTLSLVWKKPLIPVNHLVAHLYANWLGDERPQFPAIGLVVSGGHTDLVEMKNHSQIKWIGGTRDDAAGEAFDKCARLLGLPYPGGPAISKTAEKYLSSHSGAKGDRISLFPRPMINENNFDFSFSGLKTAVLNETRKEISDKNKLAAEIEEAIVDVLVKKSLDAIKKYHPKSFLLAGGVSANKRLKDKFRQALEKEDVNVAFFAPETKFSTDNAAMIASAAFFHQDTIDPMELAADPQIEIAGENLISTH